MAALALGADAKASPILAITPVTLTTNAGAPFALNIDVIGALDLYGFQFDVAFDPTVLQANDILEGGFLVAGGSTLYVPGAIDNTLGRITFTANTLVGEITGVSGSGTLATIDFVAAALGSSAISVTNGLLLDSGLNLLDFNTADGRVIVEEPTAPSVPEPATLVLFGSGLLIVYRRRRWVDSGRRLLAGPRERPEDGNAVR
jgi:general secretion pathway protein D